ncbi:hypothetical protein HPB47_004340 [Ixodes persulcatus]|uniref:Uncharacterized protein n=1 Tax=Ixodes persulcatus TaxID=34615 RepID=A0AC60PGT1_IXOPE|nr:hypothetical protein HPB47_004340 [Ixodes persulcatus]
MAADESFAEFVYIVLSGDEILYNDMGDTRSKHVPRRCFADRLNPLQHFSGGECFVRFRFTKATVASILLSLPLEGSASINSLPPSPTLQLLVALSVYDAGRFQVVTGNLVNMPQPAVGRAARL